MRPKLSDGTYLDQTPNCPMCGTPVTWVYVLIGAGKLRAYEKDSNLDERREHYPICYKVVEKRIEELREYNNKKETNT